MLRFKLSEHKLKVWFSLRTWALPELSPDLPRLWKVWVMLMGMVMEVMKMILDVNAEDACARDDGGELVTMIVIDRFTTRLMLMGPSYIMLMMLTMAIMSAVFQRMHCAQNPS